jgi:membrane protein
VRIAYFDAPLGWGELIRRTVKETLADDCLTLAATLAYYFFFALFPALLFLLAVASFFPVGNFTQDVVTVLGRWAPAEVVQLLAEQLRKLSEGNDGGLLTFGLLTALWSSSAAMVSAVSALNRAYDIEESRPWWKVRLTAIALTIALAVFVLTSLTLVMAGPRIAGWAAANLGFGSVFVWTWTVVQWPLAFLLVSTGIGLVYYFAPDAEQEWVWITPAAVLGTALWLIASLAFKFYVANFGAYNETYGAIGGVIVLLLWFYISGLALLVGAELGAEIEHASPYGKDPGEKRPGERRKIGLAAARAYRQRPPAIVRTALPQPAYAASESTTVLAFNRERRIVQPAENRSLGELFADLTRETRDLLQQEIQLAKTELSDTMTRVAKHGAFIAAGAALGYAGLLLAVGTLTLALVAVGLPAWAAGLVITVLVLVGAGILLMAGLRGMRTVEVAPRRTMQSLQDTVDVLKRQAR